MGVESSASLQLGYLPEIKQCSGCRQTKPVSEFRLRYDKRRPNTIYRSRCRNCENRQPGWNEHRSKKLEEDKHDAILKCRICYVAKPREQFAPSRRHHGAECLECAAEYKRRKRESIAINKGARGFSISKDGKKCPLYEEGDGRFVDNETKWDRLAEANARQAWRWWIRERASDCAVSAYYSAIGKPWNNPRISQAEQYKLQYNMDSEFQIRERLRRQHKKASKRLGVAELIRQAIHNGGESPSVKRLFGYTISDLKKHLEKQFKRGMNWKRFLNGEIHIDHITPISAFDLSNDEEYKRCWSLWNLRPLWAKENLSKSSKIVVLI